MNVSRRGFLQATGAGALTLYVANALGLPKAVAEGIPGGTLPATQIPQFRNRLVVAQIAPCWRRTLPQGGRRPGPLRLAHHAGGHPGWGDEDQGHHVG